MKHTASAFRRASFLPLPTEKGVEDNELRAGLVQHGTAQPDARQSFVGQPAIMPRQDGLRGSEGDEESGDIRSEDSAARVDRRGAIAADPVMRRNAARASHTIQSTVSTLLPLIECTGGVTSLNDYAATATALTIPNSIPKAIVPARNMLSSVARGLRDLLGIAEPVQWLQERIRTLRSESLTGCLLEAETPPALVKLLLRRDAGGNPIAGFWGQASVSTQNLGQNHSALVDKLEDIGQTHGSHVALGLSLALLSVHQARVGGPSPDVDALEAFHGPFPAHAIFATATATAATTDGSAAEERCVMALKVLREAARSNLFEALAKAMAPRLTETQVLVLRRFLEADTIDAASRADCSLGLSTLPTEPIATRIRAAALQQLGPSPLTLSPDQIVDNFYWDNQFRDAADGSDLAKLKQHFASVVESLGSELPKGGLMSAAHKFGLAGADRHLLKDEAARLGGLRDGEVIDEAVDAIKAALELELQTVRESSYPPLPNPLTLARLLALQDWSKENKGTLTLGEMIKGRVYPPGDALVTRLAELWVGHVAGGDVEAGLVRVPPELRNSVQVELSRIGLGFEGLFELAKGLKLTLSENWERLVEDATATIHAHTRIPAAQTPQAVGEMLAQFLEKVQFGNHARMSTLSSGTLSTGGTGVNVAALHESSALSQPGLALVPNINIAAGLGNEQVLRVGAATHGVEVFLGCSGEMVGSVGAGIGGGYSIPSSLPSRVSASVDMLFNGSKFTQLEGVMLRFDRQIVEDRVDAKGERVFSQNDAEVRIAAGEMARMLFSGAQTARTVQEREALLKELIVEFHDRGLSMTLMQHKRETHRREAAVGIGASAVVGASDKGFRFGWSSGVGVQYAPTTKVSQRDTTGTYQVSIERRGWFYRTSRTIGAGVNPYLGPYGLPATPIVRSQAVWDEQGGAVRVRIPTRAGNIVPEKSFCDTDTASPAFMKEIVMAKRNAWVDLFAFPHRTDEDEGRAKGEQELDKFFFTIDSVRAGNQRYYARERLHPDVGQRLDELASLAALVPASLPEVRDEIAIQRSLLLSDDRSWAPASLIGYEINAVEQGLAASLVGAQVRNSMTSEGEREFIFHTPGWAALRAREHSPAGQPAGLDAIDQRERTSEY